MTNSITVDDMKVASTALSFLHWNTQIMGVLYCFGAATLLSTAPTVLGILLSIIAIIMAVLTANKARYRSYYRILGKVLVSRMEAGDTFDEATDDLDPSVVAYITDCVEAAQKTD